MVHPSFYVNGPYIHNIPLEGQKDNYTKNLVQMNTTEATRIKDAAIARLRQKLQESLAVEQQFYRLFKVNSAQEWSDKFLKPLDTLSWQTARGSTIYAKTMSAINNQTVVNTLQNAINDKAEKFLEIQKEAVREQVGKSSAKKLGYHLTRKKGLEGIASMALNELNLGALKSKAKKSNQLVDFTKELQVVSKFSNENISAVQQALTEGVAQDIDKIIKIKSKEGVRLFLKTFEVDKRRIQLVKQFVYKTLTNTKLIFPTDFGYSEDTPSDHEGFLQQMREYATEVTEALEKALESSAMLSSDTLFLDMKSTLGEVGEVSITLILEHYIKKWAKESGFDIQVDNIARNRATGIRTGRTGQQLSADVRISGLDDEGKKVFVNLQVKNSLMQGYDSQEGAFGRRGQHGTELNVGDIRFSPPNKLITFFEDIKLRNLMAGTDLDMMAYQLANSLYRGDDTVISQVARLLNFAVEHVIRAATADALMRDERIDTQGDIIRSGPVMENHFMVIHGRMLLPVSSFLKKAIEILDDADRIGKFELFGMVKEFSTNKSGYIDPEQLRSDKMKAYEDVQGPVEPGAYAPGVLEIGRRQGVNVLNNTQSPEFALSLRALVDKINTISSQGGV